MPSDDPIRHVPSADSEDQPTIRGLAAGRRVFNRYVLETPAGRGGMGVVWRAQDVELERKVALKFLPEVVAGDAEAVRDLKRETKRCLELTHSNIVRVYDFVQEGPMAAIAMELVDGQSLAKRKADAGGCLPLAEVIPLAAQLCAALDYAHRTAKVVHRDLKPANLLVTRHGQLKVTDFGIARSLTDTHTRLTGRAGDTSGTLVYMSPQQLLGNTPTVADDIYTLGATLYDLLTGKPPFYSGDIVTQVREVTPPPVNQRRRELEFSGHLASGAEMIPPEWEDTIRACLEKEPEDRPQSVAEVAERLGLGKLNPEITGPEPAAPEAAPMRSKAGSRDFPSRGAAPPVPPAAPMPPVPPRTPPPPPPTAAGRGSKLPWIVAAASTALLLVAVGIYFGLSAARRPAPAESAGVPPETAFAGAKAASHPPPAEAQPIPASPAAIPVPAAPAPTGKEQRENKAIMALISGLPDGATSEQVDALGKAVTAYVSSAPEQYRAAVTAAWYKRRAELEAARMAAASRESAPPVQPAPPPQAHPAETATPVAVRAPAGGPEAAKPWTVPGLGLELLWIQPGTFEMGSAASESGRYPDEGPQTRVTFTLPFWMGRTEVTQAQWKAVMGTSPSSSPGANLPVERVSWTEAMEFCQRLTQRERAAGRLPAGYEYTLPTEAQWEYACRAGASDTFGGGAREVAWFADNSGHSTHPVGQKKPNAWGLVDMHGNVAEWCRDWYGKYPGEAVSDYAGPVSGTQRIIRGGAWCLAARNCRSARRDREMPLGRRSFVGFRLALSRIPFDGGQ